MATTISINNSAAAAAAPEGGPTTPPRTLVNKASSPPRSYASRLPSGVSGWVDLSAQHKQLGWVGPAVYQRRFFEIDWQERSIAYFNAAESDGSFVRGRGRRKQIAMSTIKKLGFPSTGPVESLSAAGRRTAFDIVTPDRTYTLVPIPPPKRGRGRGRGRGGGGGGGGGDGGGGGSRSGLVCLSIFPGCFDSEPPPASPPHPPPPPPPPPPPRGAPGHSAISSPNPDPLEPAPDQRKLDPDDLPAPLEKRGRRGPAREGPPRRPTLTVDDFRMCIASSDFSPNEASLHLARLLLSRNVTEHGTPWEFECPLTLDVMDDPVIAADGVTYDRAAIEEWFETTKEVLVSPTTLEPMTKELRPNFRMKEEIKAYKKAKIHLAESQGTLGGLGAGDSDSAWRSPC